MIKNYEDSYIWIIGASSGIGRALAQELSNRGARLVLSARRKEELEELNKELGGKHHVFPVDVADDKAVFETVSKIGSELPKLDSMVYMAATYVPTAFQDTDMEHIKKAIDINLNGAMAATLAVHKLYKKQGHGQIALCGSVAGYRGLPNAQPYSATKAALINLCETLRVDLGKENIDIKIINPGFVRTPLTDRNNFKMPMMIDPEEAAKAITDGLQSKRFEIHFPKKFTFIMKTIRVLPACVYFWIVKKFGK